MRPLIFQGPVYGASGYATAARQFLLALDALQVCDLALQPLVWKSGFDAGESKDTLLRLQALERKLPEINRAEACLLHWSVANEFLGRQGCARAIGHTVFETNSLLREFVIGCNRMDSVITPTRFNQTHFQQAGVAVPIGLVPEGVDTVRFSPTGPRLKNIPQRFSFLFLAQLSYRKGFDLVLKAFLELFAHHDDVQLLLRCYIRDGSPRDLEQVRQFISVFREQELNGLKSGHVYLLSNVADVHLPALYRSADVLLAPHRGEGWGLPIAEALSCEVPVIATGWGGIHEYLGPEHASWLNYQLAPIPGDVPEIFLGAHLKQARHEGHLLAEPDYQQLKYAMWEMYRNYFVYKAQAMQARELLETSLTWSDAAHKFVKWMELQP
ncbi:MAG: glycosyltransferase family 4 protein [Candidatus Sericytochromatia bacterium]|nr:glycosyltransferase family 4 protein [Candidatus Sericytochromatia bacterium]